MVPQIYPMSIWDLALRVGRGGVWRKWIQSCRLTHQFPNAGFPNCPKRRFFQLPWESNLPFQETRHQALGTGQKYGRFELPSAGQHNFASQVGFASQTDKSAALKWTPFPNTATIPNVASLINDRAQNKDGALRWIIPSQTPSEGFNKPQNHSLSRFSASSKRVKIST